MPEPDLLGNISMEGVSETPIAPSTSPAAQTAALVLDRPFWQRTGIHGIPRGGMVERAHFFKHREHRAAARSPQCIQPIAHNRIFYPLAQIV